MKAKVALILANALGANLDLGIQKIIIPKNNWKPELTEDELVYLRSLPKKERKKTIKILYEKYLHKRRTQ